MNKSGLHTQEGIWSVSTTPKEGANPTYNAQDATNFRSGISLREAAVAGVYADRDARRHCEGPNEAVIRFAID